MGATTDGPIPLNAALLAITNASSAAKELLASRMTRAGHSIVARATALDAAAVRMQLVTWISDPKVEIVIAIDNDDGLAQNALAPLVTESIPGFTDVFRWLALEKLGAAAMGLAVHAARCGSTFVFVLPDVPAALQTALDQLLIPQLDHRTTPRNLAKRLPRIAGAARAPVSINVAETYVVPRHAAATISPYVTTGSIAVVGNIPAIDERHVNVRAGRGGLAFLTALGVAAVAGAVALAANIVRKNRESEATISRHEEPVTAAPQPTVARAPEPALAPPVRVEQPAARGSASSRRATAAPVPPRAAKPTPAKASPPKKPVELPAALVPAPELDGMCDEVSCAANNYERECCTPFRGEAGPPDKLSRGMIAAAIEPIKPRAQQCADGTPSYAKLRVTVGSDGRVTSTMILEASESGFGQCVMNAVREATFAKTQNGGTFTYPFSFGE
jgi:molybdenum cofactor biosynthesis protein B